jgi:hypothetical protein
MDQKSIDKMFCSAFQFDIDIANIIMAQLIIKDRLNINLSMLESLYFIEFMMPTDEKWFCIDTYGEHDDFVVSEFYKMCKELNG